jgi:hypothetical protein
LAILIETTGSRVTSFAGTPRPSQPWKHTVPQMVLCASARRHTGWFPSLADPPVIIAEKLLEKVLTSFFGFRYKRAPMMFLSRYSHRIDCANIPYQNGQLP